MIVDESGTEAAAATIGTAVTFSLHQQPQVLRFVVNRSFVAVIILRQSDRSILPLFTSIVNKL